MRSAKIILCILGLLAVFPLAQRIFSQTPVRTSACADIAYALLC